MRGGGLIRVITLGILVVLAAVGVGSAQTTVTINVSPGFTITVAAGATVASTTPPNCGTTSITMNVKSNKVYNVQMRSEPSTYPNGKAKNLAAVPPVEMTNAFQYSNDNATFINTTATYVNFFGTNQPKTAGTGVNHTVYYKQCVEFADDPASYTIVFEYLGVQP